MYGAQMRAAQFLVNNVQAEHDRLAERAVKFTTGLPFDQSDRINRTVLDDTCGNPVQLFRKGRHTSGRGPRSENRRGGLKYHESRHRPFDFQVDSHYRQQFRSTDIFTQPVRQRRIHAVRRSRLAVFFPLMVRTGLMMWKPSAAAADSKDRRGALTTKIKRNRGRTASNEKSAVLRPAICSYTFTRRAALPSVDARHYQRGHRRPSEPRKPGLLVSTVDGHRSRHGCRLCE